MATNDLPVIHWPDMHLGEKFLNGVDFSGRVPSGAAIGTPTVAVTQGTVTTDDPADPVEANGIVSVWVEPTATGVVWLTVSAPLDDGETVLKARCWFRVKE